MMYKDELELLEEMADRLDSDYDNAEKTDGSYYEIWLEWKALRHLLDSDATAQAKIIELTDALEELVGWQNGPPLVTYTVGWNAAMRNVYRVLGWDKWVDQE